MKKTFITFGGGGQNYINAGKRLKEQVERLELFNDVILITDNDLKKDKVFWDKHSNFILKNKRGYGYWLWKSYIIKKKIDSLNDGDILLYLDAGCEVDITKKKQMNNFFDYVKRDFIIGGETCIEKEWTKMDLLLYLDMNKPEYVDTRQRCGGCNMFYVNSKVRKLINEWYDISCNYMMINDSPSIKKNIECFKEHRHDQSIFSLLTKKYNIFSKHSIRSSNGIIRTIRNKSKISKLEKILI